uniref:Uncharacterized protein n=1 Tax=Romanomermis culicivorax TaxID=13658 RepID=A0A915JJ59_ROMCU
MIDFVNLDFFAINTDLSKKRSFLDMLMLLLLKYNLRAAIGQYIAKTREYIAQHVPVHFFFRQYQIIVQLVLLSLGGQECVSTTNIPRNIKGNEIAGKHTQIFSLPATHDVIIQQMQPPTKALRIVLATTPFFSGQRAFKIPI